MNIVRCPSCDGYGWFEDDFTGEAEDCDWCGGIGYVYRDSDSVDHTIPQADLRRPDIAQKLDELDQQRLREMGYTGEAKKPWEQAIRDGTQGGINPYEQADDESPDHHD